MTQFLMNTPLDLSIIWHYKLDISEEKQNLQSELQFLLLSDAGFERESEKEERQRWIHERLNALSAELMMLNYEQERLENP